MREIEKLIKKGSEKAGGQDKFAVIIGIHPNSLSNVKSGKRSLPPHAIEAAANYLGEDKVTLAGKIFLEWKRVAACLILGITWMHFPPNVDAGIRANDQLAGLYIMRNNHGPQ